MTAETSSIAEAESEEPELNRTLSDAVNTWGRITFGAPSDLMTYVIGEPESRDEIIERVFTNVVRRSVAEVVSATRETRSTNPRLDARQLDPFAYTNETLKTASEYVRQCEYCRASGSVRCTTCVGGGKMNCPTCDGSGMETKYYKTVAPKQVKCKGCRQTGKVSCTDCGATGTTPCLHCKGSGHMLVWLTMNQTEHVQVTVHPESPIVHGHPMLRAGRELAIAELSDFSLVREASATRLDLAKLPPEDRPLPKIHLDGVDPKTERVSKQQYIKIAVVRRDVTFETCGSRGTLVLSGKNLLPSTTPDALRPFKKRIWALAFLVGFVAIAAALLRTAFVGKTEYFATAKSTTLGLSVASIGLAFVSLGTILRRWRGGTRFWPLKRSAIAMGAGSLASLVAICITGLVARPSVSEARDALASSDPTKARVVIEALKSSSGQSPEVLEAEDLVKLAEAQRAKGDARLAILDDVAGRHGPSAKEAALAARTDRLNTIRRASSAGDSKAALAAIERWFPTSKTADDPEVAEERARAHEVARSACTTEPCKLLEASTANLAHGSPARSGVEQSDRLENLKALDPKTVDEKDQVARLKHVRRIGDVGAETAKTFPADEELRKQATAAVTFADTERAKVMLLLSPLPVVEELLGAKATKADKVATFALDGLVVYVALDGTERCSGVYAIGSVDSRAITSTTWSPDHLLSQAIGKAAKVRQPAAQGATATSRWYEAGIPVVARWHNGDLVELRIGDATP